MANVDPLPRADGPGADVAVSSDSDLSVINAIRQYRLEAEEAKYERIARNKINRDIYLGRQNWDHKEEGQSTEFLPKVAVSVEQMASFIKRGLVNFGNYFTMDLDRSISQVVKGAELREVLKCFLGDLWTANNGSLDFTTVISDGVKLALLESLMILKVHGGMQRTREYSFEGASRAVGEADDKLKMTDTDRWRLRIDLIRPEDYYPDPTGNGLYEIHRVERDLHEVIQAAEDGIYDMEAVKQLIDTTFPRPQDEERKDEARNQPETTPPGFRKTVVLDEFWGTLLNSDGTVAHRNVVSTVANDRFLIRKPEPNPFWHQESPFVVAPIIRVPFSVWHKALYDHAAELNLAINELFNLILDGGIAKVWGVRQCRIEDLEDPNQVAGGIKQGATLAVKQTLPHNAKVVEQVTTADVPTDAMAVYEAVNREYTSAALTNELKVGQLPPKQVLATEIVEASQSQAITLDGVVADIEKNIIGPALYKAFLTIMQNADDIPEYAFSSIISKQVSLMLMRASPEERFALFAGKFQVRVTGLSATLARAMDFQKKMSIMQATTSNPILFQEFLMRYSARKFLDGMFRDLNVNPDEILKDADEQAETGNQVQMMTQLAQAGLGGGGGQRGASAPGASTPEGGAPLGGGGDQAAAINQLVAPRSGLTPNA